MSITWITPVALAGFALIALPIAIHLLVRQQTRSLPYPSLRFLRETALAAFRRRAIQDAALLGLPRRDHCGGGDGARGTRAAHGSSHGRVCESPFASHRRS